MEKNLSEFTFGDKGIVKELRVDGKIRRRLYDMGITPGAQIMFKKYAPLGDPIQINVRGYELALRKSEAAGVLMTVVS